MQECREEEAYESECNAGVRTYPYRDFRQTKCRKIKPDLPLGPVVLIDTPGIDDEGELGKLRVKKSYQVLNKTDIVLLALCCIFVCAKIGCGPAQPNQKIPFSFASAPVFRYLCRE